MSDLVQRWSLTLDDDAVIIQSFHSNLVAATEQYLYLLDETAIISQISMIHGIPSCICVNPLNENVILIGTFDEKVLIFKDLLLKWAFRTKSVPLQIGVGNFEYLMQ